MTLPALPPLGDDTWYDWATGMDVTVRTLTLSVRRLLHDGSAYPTRPDTTSLPAGYAEYVGPTEPTDWVTGDTWIQAA